MMNDSIVYRTRVVAGLRNRRIDPFFASPPHSRCSVVHQISVDVEIANSNEILATQVVYRRVTAE